MKPIRICLQNCATETDKARPALPIEFERAVTETYSGSDQRLGELPPALSQLPDDPVCGKITLPMFLSVSYHDVIVQPILC